MCSRELSTRRAPPHTAPTGGGQVMKRAVLPEELVERSLCKKKVEKMGDIDDEKDL